MYVLKSAIAVTILASLAVGKLVGPHSDGPEANARGKTGISSCSRAILEAAGIDPSVVKSDVDSDVEKPDSDLNDHVFKRRVSDGIHRRDVDIRVRMDMAKGAKSGQSIGTKYLATCVGMAIVGHQRDSMKHQALVAHKSPMLDTAWDELVGLYNASGLTNAKGYINIVKPDSLTKGGEYKNLNQESKDYAIGLVDGKNKESINRLTMLLGSAPTVAVHDFLDSGWIEVSESNDITMNERRY
ncbi:Uu.00g011640.m01.CDS01 [Anthostomella pinea]|uniref:Uu.00g011640.m01.CDS01 n=1 Tax=Anthostomella pinea TaxID=933095 RepID=A0AAI8VYE8_9PEZI|nr:Uu.00g011640.m01.CDS01 [Anthostomella pinea]